MSGIILTLRRQPVWIALAIFVILCLWVASGSLLAEQPLAKKPSLNKVIPKVRVERLTAESVQRQITLYGRTEPDRVATMRAEVRGQVEEVLVTEGQSVKAGDILIKIDSNDLHQRLVSAKATLSQRKIELEGANSLGKKGYQSQAALAQAVANVEAAKAEVQNLQLAIDNLHVVAPFDGVVNERFVEVGDLLKDGDNIATIVDLDPLVVVADVTESYIQQLNVGQAANGRLVSGQQVEGQIRYISSVSTQGTNTFKIEVKVDNPQGKLLAGMSTELAIPFQQTWAMKITPAVMALDEQGNLGVKTVEDDIVKFVPIDIVKSDSEGVWLAGLGQQADVITLGHGFVRDGDKVEVVKTDLSAQAKL